MPQPVPLDLSVLKSPYKGRALEAGRRITTSRRLRQERYLYDPVGWAHDCIDWKDSDGLAPYQEEILSELAVRRRVCVRSPHGTGKSSLASWALLWFAVTREGAGLDWKVPTTAGRWHQLVHFLWPEIHKWARRLRWDRIGREPFRFNTELMKRELHLNHGMAFAMAVGDPNALEGAHADELFYVFDEAKLIPDSFFNAAEGAFSTAGLERGTNAFAMALSVPAEPLGRFYGISARHAGTENWWARHIRIDEAIEAGRVTQEWVDQCRRLWGADSALFKNRCLGDFASAEKDSVIPLSWVTAANDRWMELYGNRLNALSAYRDVELGTASVIAHDEPLDVIGLDVARAGGDKTVYALRQGNAIIELRRDGFTDDLVVTAGKAGGIQDAHPHPGGRTAKIVVDADGIGVGVFDILRSQTRNVVAFHGSGKSRRKDASGEIGFVNKRAEAWWNMREMLDPNAELEMALPPDDRLLGDLVTVRKRDMSGSRIQVESKDEIQKRIGRSPDDGDAVVYAFFESAGGASYADMYSEIAAIERGEKPEDARARARPDAEEEEPEKLVGLPILEAKPKPRSAGGWGDIYKKPEETPPGATR